jgi:hypothetical protein
MIGNKKISRPTVASLLWGEREVCLATDYCVLLRFLNALIAASPVPISSRLAGSGIAAGTFAVVT